MKTKNLLLLLIVLFSSIFYGQFIPNGNLSNGLTGYVFQGQPNRSMFVNSNFNLIEISNYEPGNFSITTPEMYLSEGVEYKLLFRFMKTQYVMHNIPPTPPSVFCKQLPEIVLVDQNNTELPIISYSPVSLNNGCYENFLTLLETNNFAVPLSNIYRIRFKNSPNFDMVNNPYLIGDFMINLLSNYKIQGAFNPNSQTCNNGILPINGSVKLKVTNANNQTFFAYPNNQNGSYEINNLTPGNYTLQAIPHPNFMVDETPISLTLDNNNPTFTKNYCLTGNGNINDLQVYMNPLNNAIPGFVATYKIDYKNMGSQMQNATVNLHFPNQFMTISSSSIPYTDLGNGNLQFSVGNLNAYSQGFFTISFQLNAPSHPTHPLNSGNVLNFNTQILPISSDFNPADNQFALPQVVVNSYDPNDKIALEGNVLPTSTIGNYIHYRIRFENTGTFNAQNVVVKDIIDASKLDPNSIEIVSSSHPCNFRTNNNEVYFDFNNINLPFDDANNDGYVIFKIKIKSTVLPSETITNGANIFFDYNLPIATNNYNSAFQTSTMAVSETKKEKLAVFYPNPAKEFIKIETKKAVNKITISDNSGRMIRTILKSTEKIALFDLPNGLYFLTVYFEDNTIISEKIIKK